MRDKKVLAVMVSLLAAGAILAQGESKMKSAPKGGAKAPVIVPAADLKWVALSPDTPGVMSADVWGDHTKGAFRGFTKFPAGFTTPLHTHTNDMWIVVISGTFIHTPEGKPESRLGPGSYLFQAGGSYRHTTACDKASECLFFISSPGAFDIKPVEPAKK